MMGYQKAQDVIIEANNGAAELGHVRRAIHRTALNYRSDLKLARISSTNSSGCSQAAKCVPLGSLL